MGTLNKVMLIGRLGRDPQITNSKTGRAITKLSIATSKSWRDKNTQEKQEKTEWHNIVAFGSTGEVCGKYLRKGSSAYIEGRLQTRNWEKDGITRHTTEIIADKVVFLGSKREQQCITQPSMVPAQVINDLDIPF